MAWRSAGIMFAEPNAYSMKISTKGMTILEESAKPISEQKMYSSHLLSISGDTDLSSGNISTCRPPKPLVIR